MLNADAPSNRQNLLAKDLLGFDNDDDEAKGASTLSLVPQP